MNNCIVINGQQIELTQDQVAQIVAAHTAGKRELSSFAEGDVVKIGSHEMVVLEQDDGATVLICKKLHFRR